MLFCIFTADTPYDINIKCPYLRQYNPIWERGYSMSNILHLQNAIIVQKIVIDTGACMADRRLIDRKFSVAYKDASDKLRQDLVYSEVSWPITFILYIITKIESLFFFLCDIQLWFDCSPLDFPYKKINIKNLYM